jgi:hypothetical protein
MQRSIKISTKISAESPLYREVPSYQQQHDTLLSTIIQSRSNHPGSQFQQSTLMQSQYLKY